MNIVAKIFQ